MYHIERSTSIDHISKDTWHSQIMTSVNMKSIVQVRVNHELHLKRGEPDLKGTNQLLHKRRNPSKAS
jgi:hypothetical protein